MKCKIDLKLNNWNDIIKHSRANKYYANTIKKQEMKDISYFIARIPPIKKYPIKIIFTWHIKNTASDLDNKSVKSILDCMQNLGIIENDNINHINEIIYKTVKDKTDFVEMEIIEEG